MAYSSLYQINAKCNHRYFHSFRDCMECVNIVSCYYLSMSICSFIDFKMRSAYSIDPIGIINSSNILGVDYDQVQNMT